MSRQTSTVIITRDYGACEERQNKVFSFPVNSMSYGRSYELSISAQILSLILTANLVPFERLLVLHRLSIEACSHTRIYSVLDSNKKNAGEPLHPRRWPRYGEKQSNRDHMCVKPFISPILVCRTNDKARVKRKGKNTWQKTTITR